MQPFDDDLNQRGMGKGKRNLKIINHTTRN